MARHGHNGACAVTHKHIIRYKDRNLFIVNGIYGFNALYFHTGFFFGQLGTLKIRLFAGHLPVSIKFIQIAYPILLLFNQGMFRGYYHICSTEKRVRPGCEYPQLAAAGYFKVHFSAGGAADPVSLLGFYPFYIIHRIQILKQPFGILSYLQHPLIFYLADNFSAAAFTNTADHFFIGQPYLTGSAPIDGCFFLISQSFFEQLEKDPLGPLIVFGIGGINLPGPVKGKAQRF